MRHYIYQCLRNCHVRMMTRYIGQTGDRCPRCGDWMKFAGEKTAEEVQRETQERQRSYKGTEPQRNKFLRPY